MTFKKLRIIEFFLIGLVLGIAEDLLVVKSATGTRITLDVLFIASLIALPFAILSELVVDNPKFWKKIMKFLKIEIEQAEKKIEQAEKKIEKTVSE